MSRPFQNWDQSLRKPWGYQEGNTHLVTFGRAKDGGVASLVPCCSFVPPCRDQLVIWALLIETSPRIQEQRELVLVQLNCLHTDMPSMPWPSAHVLPIFLGLSCGKMYLYYQRATLEGTSIFFPPTARIVSNAPLPPFPHTLHFNF